jgi:hypothetical protein
MPEAVTGHAMSEPTCKCAELIAHYTESMEINAGSMATSSDWAGIEKVARLHCPVHGPSQASETHRATPATQERSETACGVPFEFGQGAIACTRATGHPGPHRGTQSGHWWNDEGRRVEGASAEDSA